MFSALKLALFENRRTSLLGLGGLLTMFGTCLTAQFDNDPTTVPNWLACIEGAVGAFMLLFYAHDPKETEDKK